MFVFTVVLEWGLPVNPQNSPIWRLNASKESGTFWARALNHFCFPLLGASERRLKGHRTLARQNFSALAAQWGRRQTLLSWCIVIIALALPTPSNPHGSLYTKYFALWAFQAYLSTLGCPLFGGVGLTCLTRPSGPVLPVLFLATCSRDRPGVRYYHPPFFHRSPRSPTVAWLVTDLTICAGRTWSRLANTGFRSRDLIPSLHGSLTLSVQAWSFRLRLSPRPSRFPQCRSWTTCGWA